MPKKKRSRPKHLSNSAMLLALVALMVASFLLGIFVTKFSEQKPLPAPPEVTPKPAAGFIALVVDDWGYTDNVKEFITAIDIPLAIAVLPKLPYSQTIAHYANKHNKEVMLHLPLEPYYTPDHYPSDYIIKTSMSPDKVKKIIRDSLSTVPFAQGMNSHMGSKATENKPLMTAIFTDFKERGFFVVDSLVSERSICENVAGNLGLPFIARDVFLDNINERRAIEREFAKLARLAQKKGYAVAIGHARPLTLEVIKEQSSLLKKKGFVFLSVREMIKHAKTIDQP